jgi:uncharacterized protein (TIGR02145 family)
MAIVTIGTQKWQDKNLDVMTFQDGTHISEISSSEQWAEYVASETPGWSYYDFDPSNASLYGKLYNWYAVSSSNAICPVGYRLPTAADYQTLVTHLGGTNPAGQKMKNTENWLTLTRRTGNGTNQSGFKGNPGGYIKSSTGDFWDQGWSANFWTATTASATEIVSRRLYWSNDDCIALNAPIDMGLSVRLICTGSTQQCSDGDFNLTEMF